jgi:euchromatic histone-lysine N-methyltransferase
MNRNSKGRAWYDKIYRKLASQGNVSSGLDSVKDEPEKLREEQMEGDGFKEKLSDSVLIDEKLEEYSDCDRTATTSRSHTDPVSSQSTHQTPESFRTPITCDDDTFVSVSGISRDVSNLIPFATETPASPVQEKMANTRSFSNNSVKGL